LARNHVRNSEYLPWEYLRQHISIDVLAQRVRKLRGKQIHPDIGPEKAFGMALREVRRSKEISQERLALEAGFDRTYISLIERGISSPTIRKVYRIAQTLNVAPSEIVLRMEALLDQHRPPRKRNSTPPSKGS
jgi:DNA-binding XRE family transcriptional regulator